MIRRKDIVQKAAI